MAPGGAAIRSATSRWSISVRRRGRGSCPSTRWSTGLVTWYGRLATRSQSPAHEIVEVLVEEVPLDESQASMAREPVLEVGDTAARRARPR